ncbi:transcriptional regulator with XRE-family HTH domain [Bacillus thermophilus]|uniref:Transcriptional regulator with XRE-family HTH domain n=1 Tax=Siminovitchia thermophila TaxID=1245522 RepID=A0ABS2RBX0_9BACI|nr:helix-turn-helix domain-containing protein [Siminovitchia thermophila]MBM7717158.1 transcriptional regulator with XRE-family HTH domain [Siminovitchia thermophila]
MSSRRGKYHQWLTEEGLLKLEGWAKDGLTDEQIAGNIGISRSTLNEWKKRYPDISDTLKRGKEVVDRQVENALLKRALGYEYEEVKTYIEETDGKKKKRVEKTTKHVAGDVTAQIFWLKNRKPGVWRDKKETELSGGVDLNNPFADLTTDELKKLVEDD